MKKPATKEIIKFTAFKLFLKKGFTDVSINEIVRTCGISKGGFFHYFKNKDHLLEEIIQSYILTYIEIMSNQIIASKKSTYEKLFDLFDFIPNSDKVMHTLLNDETIGYRSLYLLMMEALKKYDYFSKQYSKMVWRIYELIREQLAKGQTSGEVSTDADIDAAAYKIVVQYEGMLRIWIINPAMYSPKYNKELLDEIWHSVSV